MKEGTKLYSVTHLKCPKCQQGNLFSVPDSYHLGKVLDMPDKCTVCEQDFVKEPGFYSGALWISYPIVMGIMGFSGGLLYFLAKLPFYQVMVGTILILLILQPVIMRYSRAIWINLFVDYATINKNEVS